MIASRPRLLDRTANDDARFRSRLRSQAMTPTPTISANFSTRMMRYKHPRNHKMPEQATLFERTPLYAPPNMWAYSGVRIIMFIAEEPVFALLKSM